MTNLRCYVSPRYIPPRNGDHISECLERVESEQLMSNRLAQSSCRNAGMRTTNMAVQNSF